MPQTIMLAVHCKKSEAAELKAPLVEFVRQNYGPEVGDTSGWASCPTSPPLPPARRRRSPDPPPRTRSPHGHNVVASQAAADAGQDLEEVLQLRSDVINQTGALTAQAANLAKYHRILTCVSPGCSPGAGFGRAGDLGGALATGSCPRGPRTLWLSRSAFVPPLGACSLMESRFPVSRSAGHANVQFAWNDAFRCVRGWGWGDARGMVAGVSMGCLPASTWLRCLCPTAGALPLFTAAAAAAAAASPNPRGRSHALSCLPAPPPTPHPTRRQQKRTEQASLAFEKAAVVFNLGAVQSQLALQCDRKTDGGLKDSARLFQESAGTWAHLRDVACLRLEAPRPVDLGPEAAAMLEKLMLGQAQV